MKKESLNFKTGFVILLILGVAVFFRFYDIKNTPPGLYPDEAVNGVNALEALKTGDFKVFYPENNGREGLFMNIQALSLKILGAQAWALRIVSGVFGALTVLGLFLLVRTLWSDRLALLASYLMAVSFWPVNFSRIGFRAIMLPFVLVWTFYFLWKGFIDKKVGWVALAGLVYGIGFHTYISWRVSPLLIVLIFIMLLFIKHRVFDKKFVFKSLFVFGIGAIITMSPLLLYYVRQPADFLGRAVQVSIFNSPSPAQALTESIVKTLGMFNIYGDGNWRHNLAGRPELFWPIGIGFLIGLIYTIRHPMSLKNYFLITWFFVMLLPNFLAPQGAPHALRALGALPAVFILSAIGLNKIYTKIQARFDDYLADIKNKPRIGQIKRIKKELAVLAFVLLIFTGVWEWRNYFAVWAVQPEVSGNFDQRLTDIGNYLKDLPADTKKYVIVNEGDVFIKNIPVQAQPIIFLNFKNQDEISFITSDKIASIPKNLVNAVIIPTKRDPSLSNYILNEYPQARWADFITFKALKIK